MKANPWVLIRVHYESFRGAQSEELRPGDFLLFLGVPILCGAASAAFGVDLPVGASAGLITTAGVLSAFFFGVTLSVLEKAVDWSASAPKKGTETSWRADFFEQLAANAGYASLVSIVTAAAFGAALVAHKHGGGIVFSAIALALSIHLVLLLSMVLLRLFAMTVDRLDDARVGGADGGAGGGDTNVAEFPGRRVG